MICDTIKHATSNTNKIKWGPDAQLHCSTALYLQVEVAYWRDEMMKEMDVCIINMI
jgi:hypothetical protein